MSRPDPRPVLAVLRDTADFARQVGMADDALLFEGFHKRFKTEKPTFKALRSDVEPVRNQLAIKMREALYDNERKPRPGMKLLVKQYERISKTLLDLIYPPEPMMPEMNISGFAGAKKVKEKRATYTGDPNGVQSIVERSIALVERYSQAVGSGDFAAAYALTDSGLRAWMSYKRFVGDHQRAESEYYGPALEFHIDRITCVYADAAARKKINMSLGGWPKGTPKTNCRGAVGGFWIRNRAAQTGCAGTLWIAEEKGEYRIAKFDFWRP